MPRKLTTPEEIAKAWEKKRERDKKAQANWVSQHHDEHLARMKAQYQKKKAKKEERKKEEKENEIMMKEDKPVKQTRKLKKVVFQETAEDQAGNVNDRIRKYKTDNPSATQRDIATALSTSQSSVSRALKG